MEKWNYSYGYHVYVKDTETGNSFIFAHLSKINVVKGQNVSRDTIIGVMGATGNVTGPHLHMEMLDENGIRINNQLANYFGIPENKIGSYNSNDYRLKSEPEFIYKSHCQNLGWQEEKNNWEMAGLYGQGLRIEAVIMNAPINIQYRVHMAGIGWGPWVPNGCVAGTTGESRAIEAIEIISSSNTMVGQGYVENIGFQSEVTGTQIMIGTTGQGLRLEGFRLKII